MSRSAGLRGRLFVFGFTCALSLAPLAWAQESGAPTTLQGAADPLPSQGDRLLVRLEEHWSAKSTRTLDGDEEPISFGRETRLRSLFFLDALEVSERRVEAWALTFTLWQWQRGKQSLTDLTGLRLVLRRDDKGRLAVDPPSATKGLCEQAHEFVARQIRSLAQPDMGVFLPARALKGGETWTIEPPAAAPLLIQDGKLDAKASKVEGRLSLITATEAEVRVKANLALSRLPGTDARSKGGVWEVDTTYRWPHGLPRAAASFERRVRFSGKGRNKRPDGRGYTMQLTVEGRVRVKVLPAAK